MHKRFENRTHKDGSRYLRIGPVRLWKEMTEDHGLTRTVSVGNWMIKIYKIFVW